MRTKSVAAEGAAHSLLNSDFESDVNGGAAGAGAVDHIAYVMDMIGELQILAENNGLPVLSRVLGLALVEAQAEFDRQSK